MFILGHHICSFTDSVSVSRISASVQCACRCRARVKLNDVPLGRVDLTWAMFLIVSLLLLSLLVCETSTLVYRDEILVGMDDNEMIVDESVKPLGALVHCEYLSVTFVGDED